MGNHITSRIVIGGVLPARLRSAFTDVVEEASGYISACPGNLYPEVDGNETLPDTPVFKLYSDETNGQFTDLETFCRHAGLSYTRHSEEAAAGGAEVSYWYPGMSEPRACPSDHNGTALYVPMAVAKQALAFLRDGEWYPAQHFLEQAVASFPDLPPFVVEAEVAQTWNTEQMRAAFEVIGFAAPCVSVRRRSDGVKGSLEFQDSSTGRVYHSFIETVY